MTSVAGPRSTGNCGEPQILAWKADDEDARTRHDPGVDTTTPSVVGREAELDRIHAFLGRRDELPGGLVLEGEAGAGKTTLWRAGVAAAAASGYAVLTCRAAGAEVQLSHGALSDLLDPHLGAVLPLLPRPQRRALEVALLLEDDGGSAPDRRAIAAGALNAVRALAHDQPVLLAIDDAQWVDAPSAEVVEFVLRRLGTAPVAILASRRLPSSTAPSPGASAGVRPERALERPPIRIDVGPLSLGALQRILRTRTSFDANRRTLQRIHETSAGNPFFALELARALEADTPDAEPLSLSADLNELLAGRITGLPSRAREALFVAAALTPSTIERIAQSTDRPVDKAAADLAPAVKAAVVRVVDGTVEFGHPLLAAAAYAAVEPSERRRWHARIADAAGDPETRARHLALARPGRDAEVADLLHVAARDALGRGAPGIAAELFLEAIDRLDPANAAIPRARWVLEAAPILGSAGALDRAKELVEWALGVLPPGPDHSEGLRLLSELIEDEPGGGQRATQLLDEAIVEAGADARRRAFALLDREMIERSTGRLDLALPIAQLALAAAEEAGDLELQAYAHVRTADLEVLLGLGGDDPVARFERAEELDRQVHVDAEHSAPVMLAVCLIRAGRLDEARPRLVEGRRRAVAEGDENSQILICLCLSELEWLAGNWQDAAAYAAEGLELAEQAGLRMRIGFMGCLAALVEASRGDPERARTLANRSAAVSDEVDDIGYSRYARQVLAFLDLSLGDPAATLRSLDTYVIGHAIEGPKRIAFIGDLVEAMVQVGDIEGAANLTSEAAARGAQIRRRPLLAIADRCRALVLAVRGDLDGAIDAGSRSVAVFGELGHPFERARSLLVLGEVQRRAKHRRAARETLTEAIDAFDRLGAHLWVAKAGAERARIGGRTTIEGLSETELRVARLVAEGRTNKEVAAELFVSVRAVEANLSKIYAKLGIESRTELARRI